MYSGDLTQNQRIENEVGHLLDFMEEKEGYDEDYQKMFGQLTKVMELQQKKLESENSYETRQSELAQKQRDSLRDHELKLEELELKKSVSKEAWLTVGTHVAGLIVLMNHERAHVIASKAFGLVKKIF